LACVGRAARAFSDTWGNVPSLGRIQKKWRQKIRGIFDQILSTSTGPVDEDAVSMVADAQAAIAEVNSGMIAQGYYTSVVVLMD